MNIKTKTKDLLNYFGWNITKFPTWELKRRIKLIRNFGINVIFDVGANKGQYAEQMRLLGYKGKIISFEPLKNDFEILRKKSLKDQRWTTVNTALGDYDGEVKINVGESSECSSILDTKEYFQFKSGPSASEVVKIRKLDSVINDYFKPGDNLYLKIDTQGFEKKIIEGALESLDKIKGIQLEMSLIEIYKGETLFFEMMSYLNELGFDLYSLEDVYADENGRLMQVDGIFYRK